MIKKTSSLAKQIQFIGQLRKDFLTLQQNIAIKKCKYNTDRITPITFDTLNNNVITDISKHLKRRMANGTNLFLMKKTYCRKPMQLWAVDGEKFTAPI